MIARFPQNVSNQSMEKYAIAMISILESVLIAPAFESVEANPLFVSDRLIKRRPFYLFIANPCQFNRNVISLTRRSKRI